MVLAVKEVLYISSEMTNEDTVSSILALLHYSVTYQVTGSPEVLPCVAHALFYPITPRYGRAATQGSLLNAAK
jgi:hypothetical protein